LSINQLYGIVRSIVNIDPRVKEAAAVFTRAGKQVYLVGGAVRDLLQKRRAKDWDLATDAHPEEVTALFQKKPYPSFVIPTGIKHGTVTVHFKGLSMEVTTFRSESGYSDGRRPDSVEFGVSIEEDLSRRDFTMNAAAWRLPGGPLVDPFDGRGDIKRRFIRTVGRAEERFSEDGLRPIRALRFASQLGFTVDEGLLAAIPGAIPFTAKVAAERIRDELDRIIVSEKPSAALFLMEKTGLLELLIPELAACRGVKQDRINGFGFHRFDVLDHSLLACDFAARQVLPDKQSSLDKQALPDQFSQTVRCLAALYHDIGKPVTAQIGEDGTRTFYRHERESAVIAGNILRRFRYPNIVTVTVCHLIEEHMFHYEETWTDAAVRRFIARVGEENIADLFALRRADAYGLAGKAPPPDFLFPLQKRIEDTLKRGSALSLKDLALSGKDLIAIGIPPGKHMGLILSELLETVLDDPALNTREKLLEIAGKIRKRYE
jgi:tRNA nucleotidyltransferase/poly(A) polymerase